MENRKLKANKIKIHQVISENQSTPRALYNLYEEFLDTLD